METQGHVDRLEQIFNDANKSTKSITCDAMKGLIDEGEEMISDIDESPLRDAGLIAAGNRVEHYEIAAYGSARAFALTLGMERAAALLDQTLDEEKATDDILTRLAESMVNDEALRGSHVHQ
jgi:ferritin-like metal-binding protein YciE